MKKMAGVVFLVLVLACISLATPVTVQVLTADGVPIPARIGVEGQDLVWSWNGERVFELSEGTYTIKADYHGEEISQEVVVGADPIRVELNSDRQSLLASEFDGHMDDWYEESGGELASLEDDQLILEEGSAWFWGGDYWEDYIYTLSFTIPTPLKDYYYIRLPFRAEGAWLMHELWLEHRYILVARFDGTRDDREILVWNWGHRITHGVHYTVEIVAKGERFYGYLNGIKIFDITDPETFYWEGMVGFRTSAIALEMDRAVVVEF